MSHGQNASIQSLILVGALIVGIAIGYFLRGPGSSTSEVPVQPSQDEIAQQVKTLVYAELAKQEAVEAETARPAETVKPQIEEAAKKTDEETEKIADEAQKADAERVLAQKADAEKAAQKAATEKARARAKAAKAAAEARREEAKAGAENAGSTSVNWSEMAGHYNTDAGKSPAIGSPGALVQVFIISDFQCPVCKRAAEGLHELFGEFGKDVQWIFWQNPLEMHRRAMPLARASMAAFRQGKFWEYHDKLFGNMRMNTDVDMLTHAKDLDLDMEQFKDDLDSEELLAKIQSDLKAAQAIGARGTPSFLINGRVQVGWGSAGGIRGMVNRELTQVRKLMGKGVTREEALETRAKDNAKTPENAELYIKHFLSGAKYE